MYGDRSARVERRQGGRGGGYLLDAHRAPERVAAPSEEKVPFQAGANRRTQSSSYTERLRCLRILSWHGRPGRAHGRDARAAIYGALYNYNFLLIVPRAAADLLLLKDLARFLCIIRVRHRTSWRPYPFFWDA